MAWTHSGDLGDNCQISDKIALVLNRGANAKARNHQGETCLHLDFSGHKHFEGDCSYLTNKLKIHYARETKDILILMMSAGADVCAVDERDISVSDAAIRSGQEILWTEALKYCGIHIKDVLARPNADPARSTALSSQYNESPWYVTSNVSLTEYLERQIPVGELLDKDYRAGNHCLSSSEEDESEDEDLAEDD